MVVDIPPAESNRPYPPPSNVIAVLERLRSRNLPERIDKEYLRDVGIPEGSIHRVLFAMRFLRLTDYETPTPALRSIAMGTDEEYQQILANSVRTAYEDVFEVVDPGKDSADRIVNVFRRFTPASQRERMVVFFLGMCREAGIPTLEAPRQRSAGDAQQVGRGRATSSKSRNAQLKSNQRVASGRAAPAMAPGVPPPLELLVRSLPPEGAPLSKARREQWLEMARATLAFVYPEESEPTHVADDVGEYPD